MNAKKLAITNYIQNLIKTKKQSLFNYKYNLKFYRKYSTNYYENTFDIKELPDVKAIYGDIVYFCLIIRNNMNVLIGIYTSKFKYYFDPYDSKERIYCPQTKIIYNLTSNIRIIKIQRLYKKYIERKKVNYIIKQKTKTNITWF